MASRHLWLIKPLQQQASGPHIILDFRTALKVDIEIMSSSRAVTGTWEISKTAADALSISKGVVVAATSDNIQVIALIACEGFGATLPICPESCAKAHQLCSRVHESTVLAFLKAQIGFQKGDSGWQLSQSDAGLRFLALAACLLTIDWWRAAELLRNLFTATAADKTLIPTSQQIKQLLTAVNYRLACSGFADNIIGWRLLIEKTAGIGIVTILPPSSDILSRLILALSDLKRLGEAQSVHIKTNVAGGAWIIAFIKWCLGEPPTVILPKSKETLIQSSSRVYVYLHDGENTEISTQDVLGSISDLWKEQTLKTEDFNGMVHLPNLANRLMQYLGPETSLNYRAGREAISSGLCPVLERLRRSGCSNQNEVPNLSILQGNIFPCEEIIARTLADFFGQPTESPLKNLPENTLVEDLPSVAAVKTQIAAHCRCVQCLNNSKSPKERCSFERYMRTISKCIATVLLASLLVSASPEGVFVHFSAVVVSNVFDDFTSTIYNCLRNIDGQSCNSETVVDGVLKLIGGNKNRPVNTEHWIMSFQQGQTICPQILGNLTLQKTGLLSFLCVPGLIIHRGEKYSSVEVSESVYLFHDGSRRLDDFEDLEGMLDDDEDENIDPSSLQSDELNLQTASDMFEDYKTEWQVTARDEKLFLSIGGNSVGSYHRYNPLRAIWTASDSFFVTCAHDRGASLPKRDRWLVAADPHQVSRGPKRPNYGVVFCDDNEPVRFLSLCAGETCIIRDDACLACCIYACQSLNLRKIVC